MQKLIDDLDILFIREHWHTGVGVQQLGKDLADSAFVFGKTGKDMTKMLTGRPYWGLAVIVNKFLL